MNQSQPAEKSVFAKVIDRELPADIVFENERLIVIKNIHPLAPVHLLGITKEPFASIHDLLQSGNHQDLLWELFHTLSDIAVRMGLDNGYKLTTNVGADAGQTIFHLHVHLLGGSKLEEW